MFSYSFPTNSPSTSPSLSPTTSPSANPSKSPSLSPSASPTIKSWTQVGPDIDGEAAGDKSGTSVSLSADGTVLAICAPDNDSGHVRIFQQNGSSWTQIGSDINGEAAADNFGYTLSLSADGSILAIGARYNDGVNGQDSGHVRVFQRDGSSWNQIGQDIDGEATAIYSSYSGWAVLQSA